MDKLIFCLANSYKHGGRCIAGIEVTINNGELSIVRTSYGIPNWIRPVSRTSAGEVPNCDALGIRIFSVIKIHNAEYAGNASHSEDYYYSRLEKLGTLNPSDNFLNRFTDTWHSNIFGNRGKAVTPESFEQGNYSLMLIRTVDSSIYLDTRFSPKPRIKFTFNNTEYDLPITDPELLDKLKCNSSLYHENYGVLYIVVSLGVIHDGWHSKLAATVITPSTNEIKETLTSHSPLRGNIPSQMNIKEPPKTRVTNNVSSEELKRMNERFINLTDGLIFSSDIQTDYKQTRRNERTINNRKLGNQPSQNVDNGGCYVATAIYGSYDCPEVWTLRRFRDETLSKSILGKLFIKIYYTISPKFVEWFGDKLFFSKTIKPILDSFVEKLRNKGY